MGIGNWLSDKRFAVFVKEWGKWWVGQMVLKKNKLLGMNVGLFES
jgi:hypothetical protein